MRAAYNVITIQRYPRTREVCLDYKIGEQERIDGFMHTRVNTHTPSTHTEWSGVQRTDSNFPPKHACRASANF